MKKCPFCAEEVQDEAIKCKHCGEFLDGKSLPKPKQPWYSSAGFIIICLLTVGPLALPLVWINPRWNIYVKAGITVGVCILSWLMWVWMNQMLKQLHSTISTFGLTL